MRNKQFGQWPEFVSTKSSEKNGAVLYPTKNKRGRDHPIATSANLHALHQLCKAHAEQPLRMLRQDLLA